MPAFVLLVVTLLFIFLGCRMLWKTSAVIAVTFAILGALLGLPEGPPGIISGLLGGLCIGMLINEEISKL